MKRIFYLFVLFFFLQEKCLAQLQADFIIRNVNIISPEKNNPLLAGRDVFIKDGFIIKIDKTSDILPEGGDRIIEGAGKYLMSGLSDMHVHIPEDDYEKFLLMNLAAGVTTVRSMRGDTSHISLKQKIEERKMLGPDLILSAPAFSSRTNIKEEELKDVITSYKQAGFDLIKVLSVPDSSYFEKLLKASNKNGLMAAGHSPAQVPIKRVIESGYSCIEHLQGLIDVYQEDTTLLEPLIGSLKTTNTYNCPTLDWYHISTLQFTLEELKARKGLELIDSIKVKNWTDRVENYLLQQKLRDQDSVAEERQLNRKYIQDKLRLVKKLNEAEAPLILSPDASGIFAIPGFNMYEEMKLFSNAGISNKDILKITVYNPAEYMGEEKEWGSIRKGMKANLILLTENPLDSIENIESLEAVFSHGNYLKTEDLINQLNKLVGR